jgi:nitrogen regulatory protein P-II 1
MAMKNLTAIISPEMVEPVEERLRRLGVPGLSVSHTKGYGAYKNFYQRDLMTTNARLQLFLAEERVAEVVTAIRDVMGPAVEDGGILAVSPVDEFHQLSSQTA